MKLPKFYEAQDVGTLRRADLDAVMTAARLVNMPPSDADDHRVLLLLIDPQVDFIHENGALAVPGAVEDTRRTIEWMYRNMERITDVAVSLDTHFPMQIFYPGWWQDADGNHPEPMTPISADDLDSGRWTPVIEKKWSHYYVLQLENRARKTLMIWPYHTMLGTLGHSITPALYEAITLHSEVRQSEVIHVMKGRIAKTEYYSMLEPEVKIPGEEGGTLNSAFFERMAGYDAIYVAGQARSHCVLETITSIAKHEGYKILPKVHLLEDCTSPVAHPDIDFATIANDALYELQKRGLKRITSDAPILTAQEVWA